MRQLLREEFFSSFKKSRYSSEDPIYVEVFVNPTISEINECFKTTQEYFSKIVDKYSQAKKHLRWIISKDKKIYIFPAHFVHDVVLKEVFKASYYDGEFLLGDIIKENNSYKFNSDSLGYIPYIKETKEEIKKFLKIDLSWVDNYFEGLNDWLKKKLAEAEKIIKNEA